MLLTTRRLREPRNAEAVRGPQNRRAPGWRAAIVEVLAAGVLAVYAGPALASSPSCGDTITANTTVHRDLHDCAGDGLVIGADNIMLNLNGHTIDGDATPSGDPDHPNRGVRLEGHHGVTVERGTVQEFDAGIGLDAASDNRLRHLTVVGNAPGRGIDLENHSDRNRIERNRSSENARSGIVLVSSDRNLILRNTTSGNGLTGIAGFTASHNRITQNVMSANGSNGLGFVDGSDDNRITANSASDNGFDGAFIVELSDRNVITGNSATHNGNGILLSGNRNIVANNLFADAGGPPFCDDDSCGVGISVEGGTANLVALNSVARTTQQGIRLDAFEAAGGLPAIGNVFRANLVRAASTDGVSVATSRDPNSVGSTVKDTLLSGNIVVGSGHDGINVASAATTLTGNLAIRNANFGIEAVFGVTDGGGNHAFGNGNPLECVNVDC